MTQSQTIIVQCKCYDPYRRDAYSELEKRIEDDYLSARCHFSKMEQFVVCTTLDVKAKTQDKIASVATTVPIDIWFWGDIERVLKGIHLANQSYAQDFEAPLFLHRDQSQVCLRLSHTDLRLSNLSSINFRNAFLRGADMVGVDLRNADMYNADLCDADMAGADLRGADLRYASLTGTILPDGFQSMDHVKQVEHLRKMEIIGLNV